MWTNARTRRLLIALLAALLCVGIAAAAGVIAQLTPDSFESWIRYPRML